MNRRMKGPTDGWMDGWMDGQILFYRILSATNKSPIKQHFGGKMYNQGKKSLKFMHQK